jgi:hypothetical protein
MTILRTSSAIATLKALSTITGFSADEPYRIDYTVELLPADIAAGVTLASAQLLIGTAFGATIASIEKNITPSASADGQISDTASVNGKGALHFLLTADETALLLYPPETARVFSVMVTDSLARLTQLDAGVIYASPYTLSAPHIFTLTLAPPSGYLAVGEQETIGVSATRDGQPFASPPLIWESLTPATATVDATGKVTGAALGTVTIRATWSGTNVHTDTTYHVVAVRALTPLLTMEHKLIGPDGTTLTGDGLVPSINTGLAMLEATSIYNDMLYFPRNPTEWFRIKSANYGRTFISGLGADGLINPLSSGVTEANDATVAHPYTKEVGGTLPWHRITVPAFGANNFNKGVGSGVRSRTFSETPGDPLRDTAPFYMTIYNTIMAGSPGDVGKHVEVGFLTTDYWSGAASTRAWKGGAPATITLTAVPQEIAVEVAFASLADFAAIQNQGVVVAEHSANGALSWLQLGFYLRPGRAIPAKWLAQSVAFHDTYGVWIANQTQSIVPATMAPKIGPNSTRQSPAFAHDARVAGILTLGAAGQIGDTIDFTTQTDDGGVYVDFPTPGLYGMIWIWPRTSTELTNGTLFMRFTSVDGPAVSYDAPLVRGDAIWDMAGGGKLYLCRVDVNNQASGPWTTHWTAQLRQNGAQVGVAFDNLHFCVQYDSRTEGRDEGAIHNPVPTVDIYGPKTQADTRFRFNRVQNYLDRAHFTFCVRQLCPYDPYALAQLMDTFHYNFSDTGPRGSSHNALITCFTKYAGDPIPRLEVLINDAATAGLWSSTASIPITALGQFPANTEWWLAVIVGDPAGNAAQNYYLTSVGVKIGAADWVWYQHGVNGVTIINTPDATWQFGDIGFGPEWQQFYLHADRDWDLQSQAYYQGSLFSKTAFTHDEVAYRCAKHYRLRRFVGHGVEG